MEDWDYAPSASGLGSCDVRRGGGRFNTLNFAGETHVMTVPYVTLVGQNRSAAEGLLKVYATLFAGTAAPQPFPIISQSVDTVVGRQYKLVYTFTNTGECLLNTAYTSWQT